MASCWSPPGSASGPRSGSAAWTWMRRERWPGNGEPRLPCSSRNAKQTGPVPGSEQLDRSGVLLVLLLGSRSVGLVRLLLGGLDLDLLHLVAVRLDADAGPLLDLRELEGFRLRARVLLGSLRDLDAASDLEGLLLRLGSGVALLDARLDDEGAFFLARFCLHLDDFTGHRLALFLLALGLVARLGGAAGKQRDQQGRKAHANTEHGIEDLQYAGRKKEGRPGIDVPA